MRRHLHRHPELSGQEYHTTRYLSGFVERLGLRPHLSGDQRGLIADFDTYTGVSSRDRVPGKRLALRGDIDALPIHDAKQVDYRSLNEGVMHACGHDVHPTVVCGALQLLMAMHESNDLPWPVSVRGILQPAEEIAIGARHMIDHDAIEGVHAIIALHVDPSRPVGRIGLRAGLLTAACDMIHVDFQGRGGHGARPHLCDDPIDACTLWVQSAFRTISRVVSAAETVVLSIGQLTAGHSANVIPDHASLSGSLRSLDAQSRQIALDALRSVGNSVREQTGCQVEMRLGVSAPAVINDGRMIRVLSDSAVEVISSTAPDPIAEPSMGSEDFSYYLQQVPGAMVRLGVAGPTVGTEPLHTTCFDVDEGCLAVGVKLFAAAVINEFDPESDL
ncbi:MAG: amidohydrolase [Planctomycetota bacterium]